MGNFVYYTYKHNYILPISTVRIQLHISVLYVDHLQVEIFNLQISYTRCVGGGDEISSLHPCPHKCPHILYN